MEKKKERPPFQQIGWRELVALPDLGIDSLNAKVDTGARTSAINSEISDEYEQDGQTWLAFTVRIGEEARPIDCRAPLIGRRNVKNTSGVPETRAVVTTVLVLGNRHWQIDVTLADRERMRFDMILGRTAIRGRRLCVNPGRSYLAGPPVVPAV